MKQKKIKTVIVDDNVGFCNILMDFLSNQNQIDVVGLAHDGVKAIQFIQKKKPDLLVLDIVMPYIDGLAILEKIKTSNINPELKIIVISALGLDKITESTLSLGADYYLAKPFDLEIFMEGIEYLFNKSNIKGYGMKNRIELNTSGYISNNEGYPDMKEQIANVMHIIGVPTNMAGYLYLTEAIAMTVNTASILPSVTKDIYPYIAKKYNTAPVNVERSMKSAIDAVWSKGSSEIITELFGSTTGNGQYPPTNRHFIAGIVDMLRLKNKIS